MEELKKLSDINKPDERNLHFCVMNEITRETRPFDITDIYNAVDEIKLTEKVPEDIISQFNVARNLAIYSWHSYSFNQISELKAFSCIEMALRDRLSENKIGLKALIKKAVRLGLIKDKGFVFLGDDASDSTKYSESLIDVIPHLRNDLAHGSATLHPGAVGTLQKCAEFITQLYENEISKQLDEDKECSQGIMAG